MIMTGWITLALGWVCFALPMPIAGSIHINTGIGGLLLTVSLVVSVVVIAQGHAIGTIQLLVNVIGSPIVWFLCSLFWIAATNS